MNLSDFKLILSQITFFDAKYLQISNAILMFRILRNFNPKTNIELII